jgi:hypothetical protein
VLGQIDQINIGLLIYVALCIFTWSTVFGFE